MMEPTEIADLLRGNKETVRLVTLYAETRIASLYTALSVQLLNERDSDTLRGRIAELQKLKEALQDNGE